MGTTGNIYFDTKTYFKKKALKKIKGKKGRKKRKKNKLEKKRIRRR
jgi:hypothetical protein